jgi:hypothetical protein
MGFGGSELAWYNQSQEAMWGGSRRTSNKAMVRSDLHLLGIPQEARWRLKGRPEGKRWQVASTLKLLL